MNALTTARNATPARLWLRLAIAIVAITLASFAIPQSALSVNPPPDGGYPNQNTAEGDGALASLTGGSDNTAIGFDALFSNTTGDLNTASGDLALFSNTRGVSNTATGHQALYSNTIGSNNTAS